MPEAEVTRIVTGRRIISMTDAEPEAFACRGEWIIQTGSLAELTSALPDAEVRDFSGATIVPGFNDAHQHPTICAEQLLQVDLSADRIGSTDELLAALSERAEHTPAGEWVVGCGYDPARSSAGVQVTRGELDEACPQHPVLVVHVTLHTGALNSRGLELAGYRSTADAPSGGELDEDAAGGPTGVVHDQALYDLAFPAFTRKQTIIAQPGWQELAAAFDTFASRLHAAGITSVTDAAVGPPGWQLLSGMAEKSQLSLRVNALLTYEHMSKLDSMDTTAAGNRLRVRGIKAFADGAVNGGACLLEQPAIGADGHGLQRMPTAELNDLVRDVHDAGWPACVHANGDRAIRLVLDAVEQAQQGNPRPDPRHRIEHGSVVNAELIARLRDLDVEVVPFSAYATAHGDKLRAFYEPERTERMFAHRSMLDAGVVVAGSSDYPCGPFEPLFALQSCVTRRDRNGEPFGASQRITAREALALYTTNAAYATGQEDIKGRLAPGQLADFAVLDGDPLAEDPENIAAIPVRETWVGAQRVWPRA